jgi:hypothetical protein
MKQFLGMAENNLIIYVRLCFSWGKNSRNLLIFSPFYGALFQLQRDARRKGGIMAKLRERMSSAAELQKSH